MDFESVSYGACAAAAVAFFLVGGIWYGPLFGKTWMRESGVTAEQASASNLPLIMISTIVLEFLGAVGLAAIIGENSTLEDGLKTGLAVGALVVVSSLAVMALYERKSMVLASLNSAYNLLGFVAMGAVIGAMQ